MRPPETDRPLWGSPDGVAWRSVPDMIGDPRDSAAVADAVARWAVERFGGPVEVADDPSMIAGGLDSYVHAIDLRGASLPPEWVRPLVVRMLSSLDRAPQATREAAAQSWSAAQGYNRLRRTTVSAWVADDRRIVGTVVRSGNGLHAKSCS